MALNPAAHSDLLMDEKRFWVELGALSDKCRGQKWLGLPTLKQLLIAHLRDDPDRLRKMDEITWAMEREHLEEALENNTEIPQCYDSKFFVRDPFIRGGSILLRGTRMTPAEVLALAKDGKLKDYPQITFEDVEACIIFNDT